MSNEFLNRLLPENFCGTQTLYNEVMRENIIIHDLVYPHVFGKDQYIGQFSDNSVDELQLMGQSLDLPKGSRVLDIGAGRGRVAVWMAHRFSWKITGIDLAEIPIQEAKEFRKQFPSIDINFIHANIYDYQFDSLFDGLYGTGAFCHFNAENLFKHCYDLLQPSGRMTFMERIRLGPITNADWQHLTADWNCPYVYSKEEYETLLEKSGFKSLKAIDLTGPFRLWQERSVSVRENLKHDIIKLTSQNYYDASLNLAKYENDVTGKGLLGYMCFTAIKQ
jgi:SAM-dependent methyltransferase